MQWAGEEYLLEELVDISGEKISKQAPVGTMKRNYLMFHTMAPELAIEDLKEINKSSLNKRHTTEVLCLS